MNSAAPDWLTLPRIAAFCILVFVIILLVLTRLSAPPQFDFYAGAEDSAFYQDALRYQEILARDGVRLNLITTKGSLDNVDHLMAAEQAAAAFVDAIGAVELSGEVQAPATESDGSGDEDPLGGLTSLGAIYMQPVWMFKKNTTFLDGLESESVLRLGIGPEGSTSRLLVRLFIRTLQSNVNVELLDMSGPDKVVEAEEVLERLRSGEVHAVVAVGQPQAQLVDHLLRAPDIDVAEFRRAAGYSLHFPYLASVRLPEGGYDLGENVPAKNIDTLAVSTELVVTELFPPPLADLLLQATSEIYGEASLFTERGTFPNRDMVSLDLNSSAARYYESGPPLLRRYVPFQLATWIDRFIMVIVTFGSLIIALFSILPKLFEIHLNRKLDAAFRDMESVEKDFVDGGNRDALLKRLETINVNTAGIRIYLRGNVSSWLEMRQCLHDLRERIRISGNTS